MASPNSMSGPSNWNGTPQNQYTAPMAPETEETGLQARPMGLKVHYTFDKEGRVNCLARGAQKYQIQTVPLDERTRIGIIDLRLCLQCISQCSPEIFCQNDRDFAIYASDYSEPDTPLVGQGMLSWVLSAPPAPPVTVPDETYKVVTGRVTKNVMALFGNGNPETLEVKLKFTEVARISQAAPAPNSANNENTQSQATNAPTPSETGEWNSFLQSNPGLGRTAGVSAVQSPNLPLARPEMQPNPPPALPPVQAQAQTNVQTQVPTPAPAVAVPMSRPGSRPASRPVSRQSSMPPVLASKTGSLIAPKPTPLATGYPPVNRDEAGTLPTPTETSTPKELAPARPSRSRRSRSRVPTGRPRGRPRKQQANDGSTSAAEEAPTDADGEDGPKRKRAKTTKADYPTKTSLDAPPESLRVAASTAGSLRTLRPVMAGPTAPMAESSNGNGNGNGMGSHLQQEMPRAPTPVPQGVPPRRHHARKLMAQKSRRESLADLDADHMMPQGNQGGDARSPADSLGQSPENYTPDGSPADIGSSPPVPRSTTYIPQSSPFPSSPILPPMPRPQPDSGFMSGGIDDLFDEDECMPDAVHMQNAMQEAMQGGVPNAMHAAMQDAMQEAMTDALNDVMQDAMDNVLTAPTPSEKAVPTSVPQPQPQPQTQSQSQAQSQPQPPPVSVPTPATATEEPVPELSTEPVTELPAGPTNQQSHAAHGSRPSTPSANNARKNSKQPAEQYSFKAINPGPPELLPVTSIYDPPQPRPRTFKLSRAASTGNAVVPASLKRSYSEPVQPPVRGQSTGPMPSGLQNEVQHEAQHVPEVATSVAALSPELLLPSIEGNDTANTEHSTEIPVNSTNGNSTSNAGNADNNTNNVQQPTSPVLPSRQRQSTSVSVSRHEIPASDPPALPNMLMPSAPPAPTAFSEAPCPPSDIDMAGGTRSKNLVRRAAIRERLQKAIESGEMPPFCQNCGAIETPTWRKMWTQCHDGEPGYHEYSEKPGQVTAIDVLQRDEDGKPTKYRLVKKALGPTENSKLWTEMLLCNPCGIWLGKFKCHRPSDRWDKDNKPPGQGRKRRDRSSRSKKARSKSEAPQLTSEAYFTTDPIGPAELDEVAIVDTSDVGLLAADSTHQEMTAVAEIESESIDNASKSFDFLPFPTMPMPTAAATATATATTATATAGTAATPAAIPQPEPAQLPVFHAGSNRAPASGGSSGSRRELRSTHSTHSTHSHNSHNEDGMHNGMTAEDPISLDDHFGSTRRLLFPSPRKDNEPKTLGELSVNVVTSVLGRQGADGTNEADPKGHTSSGGSRQQQDDMADLFGTPPSKTQVPARPSTPPPQTSNGGVPGSAFKTPTRPTPTHRPITRSISKSIRSGVSHPKSPGEALMLLQRTPSKTPRSSGKRRAGLGMTPSRQTAAAIMGTAGPMAATVMTTTNFFDGIEFDSPLTSTLNQLLSEANEFTTGSSSHGLDDIDLVNMDFGSYLDNELMLQGSSSPLLSRKGSGSQHRNNNGSASHQVTFGEALVFDDTTTTQ